MEKIIESEFIKIETKNDLILNEISNSISSENLYIPTYHAYPSYQGFHNIYFTLRKYDFNLLSFFKNFVQKRISLNNMSEIVDQFLTMEEFFVDYDEDYPLTYPIPIDPKFFRDYCQEMLNVIIEDDNNYIWILPNTHSSLFYTINGNKYKLSTIHTNYYWKEYYNEKRKDECQLISIEREIHWIKLNEGEVINTEKTKILPQKINIDSIMKSLLNEGIIFSEIAIRENLKIYKSN